MLCHGRNSSVSDTYLLILHLTIVFNTLRLNCVCLGCGPVILRYAILMTAALALTFFIILHNDFRLELTEMRLKFNKSTKANLSEEEVGFLCPEEKVYKEAKEVSGC